MVCLCVYGARITGGQGSRTSLDFEKMKSAGWLVEKKGKSFVFRTPAPERKFFKSSKDVATFLEESDQYSAFVRCQCGNSNTESSAGPFYHAAGQSSESDEDYRPESDEPASSAYEDTPIKEEASVPILHGHPQPKRLKIDADEEINLPLKYFVGMINQFEGLLEQINKSWRCATEDCYGLLVPTSLEEKGLGGAIKLRITCNGCGVTIHYASSMVCLTERRRNCVSLALGLCFLIWGHGYPIYHKILKLGLGIQTLAYGNFYNIIKKAHPVVKSILDEICELGKNQMKAKDPSELGSFKKAVTTSDGCWLIRGHHSQCCTFVIVNFLSGCTLYYGHACMRGSNNICDSELWEGTAKAAEGHLAEMCFSKAKEEGMVVAVNWQDADSSSAKSFRYVFPDSSLSRIMLCGGHVGRSHSNNLKDYKGKKSVETSFIASKIKDYPQLKSAKCECAGKRAHSKNCGCMSDAFLARAKSNHFSALKQSGSDPNEYANRMRILGKYHSRDIHQWSDGDGKLQRCPWHPQNVCSCGNCDKGEASGSSERPDSVGLGNEGSSGSVGSEAGEANRSDSEEEDSEDSEDSDGEHNVDFECGGKPYQVRGKVLTCELHSLLYEIECDRMAEKASEVIDSNMGKGHSNLPESKFNVLTKFRPKDINLHQTHYEFSTNLGLCQGNMTFLVQQRGYAYHWARDLFARMGLPEVDGLDQIITQENNERMKRLQTKQTERVKKQRITFKQKRQEEQKKRRQYTKRQRIVHSYGNDEEEMTEEEALAAIAATMPEVENDEQSDSPNVTKKKCVCGGTDHQKRSSKRCPLYQKK